MFRYPDFLFDNIHSFVIAYKASVHTVFGIHKIDRDHIRLFLFDEIYDRVVFRKETFSRSQQQNLFLLDQRGNLSYRFAVIDLFDLELGIQLLFIGNGLDNLLDTLHGKGLFI